MTLDGNEQYKAFADFATWWRRPRTPALARLWRSFALVEQPLDRGIALDATATEGLDALGRQVPIVVDESDGDLEPSRAPSRWAIAGYRPRTARAS